MPLRVGRCRWRRRRNCVLLHVPQPVEQQHTADRAQERPDRGEEPAQFGLHVEELTPELVRKLGMGKLNGLVVTEVDPASFAEEITFARGDVILEINRVPVNSLADYRAQMSKLKPGQDVLFKVAQRAENERVLTRFLAGVVPSPPGH